MLNKFIKSISVILCLIGFSSNLNAQCSDIYFYRFNSIQCDRPVYLSQDGERIATVRLGDRYKATVCSPGQYTFVVKTNEDNLSLIQTSLDVRKGQNYYVKIGCTFGVDVATVIKKSESKGKKDFKKGSKFKGAVQQLNLKNASVVTDGGGINDPVFPVNSGENRFKRSQVFGNFKFDVVNMVKAGDMLSVSLKVTNLTSEDLILYTSYYNIYFYDDMGNLLSANDLCLVNSCDNGNSTIKSIQAHANSRTEALMPYGIPMNMNFNIKGIRNGSKKLTRGKLQMGFYRPNDRGNMTSFDVDYFDVVYPEVVDANKPNKRNLGAETMELLEVNRIGDKTVAKFEYINGGTEAKRVTIKSAIAYDELGSAYNSKDISFTQGNQKSSERSYYHTIAPNTKANIYLSFDKVSPSAKMIKRLGFDINGFKLTWKDLLLTGNTSNATINGQSVNIRPSNSNYINYTDFEIKARNNENVVGKKIILENIYFNSGSDGILDSSHPQLDQLTQILLSKKKLKLEISGHTDNVGDDLPNMLLSQKRADSIRYYLIGKSIDPSRITSVGKGATQAIANNNSDTGRQQNRRVEIKIIE